MPTTDHRVWVHFSGGVPGHLHVYLPSVDTEQVLDAIEALHVTTEQMGAEMALDLTHLQAAVASNGTVIGSAKALLEGLSAEVQDLIAQLESQGVDTAALQAFVDQLAADTTVLSEAVVANTPAATEPPA